ncbi:MAG: aminoacyl-tRNA hydrolase [Proteobacteria bacterium]|nr:aminoacyl-tRNA hydrolase [Pseudomonadota bacterium]MBU4470915.1 aminoacyl-tRNA hydrolase [Pseudomonadota bacterium]MCG2751913.1 aminoacyl-tRNA hydrolase [Desulfobacteraceae bacterium]
MAKPQTFMNRSGLAVSRFLDFFSMSHKDLLVIHDEIDLEFGIIKIKEKGGDGGHKGIRSIIDAVGSDDFIRLRMGIGRPGHKGDVSGFVLSPFTKEDRLSLDKIIQTAREAILTILCKGAKEGMNRYNKKNVLNSSE